MPAMIGARYPRFSSSPFTLFFLACFVTSCFTGEVLEGFPTKRETTTVSASVENHVVELNNHTIRPFIEKESAALVLFYAPWCHWCREFLPKFGDAAELLHSQGLPVKLAQIDTTMYAEVAQEYSIQAFPTLRFFLDGFAHEYSGGRSKLDVVNWVTHHLQTELTLGNVSQLDAFLKNHKDEPALIALVPEPIGQTSPSRETFVKVSRKLDRVGFAEIANRTALLRPLIDTYHAPPEIESLQSFVLMMNPHAAHYPKTEKPVILYGESLTNATALERFVRTYLFPALVDFDSDIATHAFSDGRPVWVLVTPPGVTEAPDSTIARAVETSRALADEFRGDIIFVHSHGSSIYDKRLLNVLGIELDELPTIRIVSTDPEERKTWYSTLKYKPDAEVLEKMDPKGLKRFVRDFLRGRLRPFIKSEPPLSPEENTGRRALMHDSSAEAFQREVLDSPYDVVVDIYAPWCGHCRKLEPVYRELASLLRPFKRIKVMKMDATRNEVKLRIAGFPTIILFPANKQNQPKQPLYYFGSRTVEAMLDWILREGSSGLTVAEVMQRRKTASSADPWLIEEL